MPRPTFIDNPNFAFGYGPAPTTSAGSAQVGQGEGATIIEVINGSTLPVNKGDDLVWLLTSSGFGSSGMNIATHSVSTATIGSSAALMQTFAGIAITSAVAASSVLANNGGNVLLVVSGPVFNASLSSTPPLVAGALTGLVVTSSAIGLAPTTGVFAGSTAAILFQPIISQTGGSTVMISTASGDTAAGRANIWIYRN